MTYEIMCTSGNNYIIPLIKYTNVLEALPSKMLTS